MKLTLSILEKRTDDGKRRAPSHLFGGRVRASTLLLIVAFLVLWWVYGTYGPHGNAPATQYVPIPPGMQPDPNYTWVPRDRVGQQAPSTKMTPTTPPTPTPTPPTTTTTPGLPCLVPSTCGSSTTQPAPPSQLPLPGTGPGPGPAPPAS